MEENVIRVRHIRGWYERWGNDEARQGCWYPVEKAAVRGLLSAGYVVYYNPAGSKEYDSSVFDADCRLGNPRDTHINWFVGKRGELSAENK